MSSLRVAFVSVNKIAGKKRILETTFTINFFNAKEEGKISEREAKEKIIAMYGDAILDAINRDYHYDKKSSFVEEARIT